MCQREQSLPGRAQLTLGYEHFQDRRTDDRGIPSWNGRPLATDRASFFGNPDESFTWVRLNALSAQLEAVTPPDRVKAFPGFVETEPDSLVVGDRAHDVRDQQLGSERGESHGGATKLRCGALSFNCARRAPEWQSPQERTLDRETSRTPG